MEMEYDEPPENIASFNYKGFIMGLVGFEMMSTQPLTDHNNYLPLWAMGEEQEGHQVPKSSFTKAVVEGGSQGAPPVCRRLMKTTNHLILKATTCS